jgi:hypothetical protein
MPEQLSPEEIDRLARKRAGAKMGWYAHACMYVLVNAFMFAASYYGFRGRSWSMYPVLGWGLGLALHGVAVFVLGGGSGLREKLVERERERLRRELERRP